MQPSATAHLADALLPGLPAHLEKFVDTVAWTFAKTMPEWPHEYIVRSKVNEDLFVQLVVHIRKYGYEGHFYQMPITYFDHGGRVYWTMGAPIAETTIINRCWKEDSFEYCQARRA